MPKILPFILTLNLAAGSAWARPSGCLFPEQKAMVVAELFFGRDIEGRSPLSDSEWSAFVVHVVAKEFPDGFTVVDGDGGWLDPLTHKVVRERTKVLTVAVSRSTDLVRRLRTVIDSYRREFHQRSVGLVTARACAAF